MIIYMHVILRYLPRSKKYLPTWVGMDHSKQRSRYHHDHEAQIDLDTSKEDLST